MATTAAPELVSVNPATLEPVGSVRRTDPGELPGIVAASRAAQERWWAIGPSERAKGIRLPPMIAAGRGWEGSVEVFCLAMMTSKNVTSNRVASRR